MDILPVTSLPTVTTSSGIPHIRSTPLSKLVAEWTGRNDMSYNQILLCISLELQMAIDETDVAKEAWDILVKKFESHVSQGIVDWKGVIYHCNGW